MNIIVPIILILSSVAVFFGYVEPNNTGSSPSSISSLKAEQAQYNDLITNSSQIVSKMGVLANNRTQIPSTDIDRLERLLPSNIDNIRLIVEVGNIIQNTCTLKGSVNVGDMSDSNKQASVGVTNSYGTLPVSFSVNCSYTDFLKLLQDLENNLRLLDVTSISFSSTDTGFYDFSVNMNTYWLK